MDESLKSLKSEMAALQNENTTSAGALQKIRKDFEQSAAELQAANLTIIRLQVVNSHLFLSGTMSPMFIACF